MTDKPEPPAEVWVPVGAAGETGSAFTLRENAEYRAASTPPFVAAVRYVPAPEGSAVIPPELVQAISRHGLASTFPPNDLWSQFMGCIRAARGGAS